MDFAIEAVPRADTEKEQMYDLAFNKETILNRIDLKTVLEKIKALVEAIHSEPKKEEPKEKKEEKKEDKKK